MVDFDAQLPVRSTATEFTTEIANASGTTVNPSEDYAQGSTTSGQNGILTQGAATTAAPTYTTGTTNPLSLDTSGNLRVLVAGSALQNVNVTEWNSVVLGSPSAYGTSPGAVEVIGTNAFVTNTVAENLTEVGGSTIALGQTTMSASLPVTIASNQTILSTTDKADGTTGSTVGTTAILTGADVVSAAPTLTAGNLSSLYVTTAGRLIVDGSQVTQPVSGTVSATQGTSPWVDNLTQVGGASITLGQKTSVNSVPVVIASDQSPINVQIGGVTPVVTYNTTAALASGSSTSFTLSGPVNLDQVHATASGEIKVVIAIGVTGSEATNWVGFTSASNKNFDWYIKDPISIPSGSDCKVTITNKDTAAMDVYQFFINH